jgi:hypothetical protein
VTMTTIRVAAMSVSATPP